MARKFARGLRLFFGLVLLLNMVKMSRNMSCYGYPSSNQGCDCKSNVFYDLFKQTDKSYLFSYQVVIDAGSTGTRVHVFKFQQTSAGFVFEDAFYHEIEPGLSFYLEKPKEGVYSIHTLLQQALRYVPENQWKSTPVSLRATAGLRLLPDIVAENIIKQVGNALVLSPFKTIDSDFISIMDGDDEGVFAWITLNFLIDNLNKHSQKTIGTLDLGGGSTQIVFKPISEVTISRSPESHLSNVKILGKYHNLYSFSYLGLGLMSARQAVFEFTKVDNGENEDNQTITASPCVVPSYEGSWAFAGKEITVRGNQSFSYDNCLHYVEQIVIEVHKPVEIVNTTFYAFSYYYEIAIGLELVEPNIGGTVSLERYLKAAKRVCSNKGDINLSSSPFLCLDAVYVTTLLRNGFGFLENQLFQVTNKVNNVELGWALGAALQMIQEN